MFAFLVVVGVGVFVCGVVVGGVRQKHIFGDSKEEQALRWRNFKGMEARELHKHFVEHVFIF